MKEKILDAAELMVQERGLNAVSYQQLATAVGMGKASIFHHFPNKEALAKSLVERCTSKHAPLYQAVIDRDDLTAPEKLEYLALVFERGVKKQELCLLGTMGSSVNTLSDDVKGDLKATAHASIQLYAKVFEQGKSEVTLSFEGTVYDAATAFLAMMQGLQILVRASEDHELFMSAARSYISALTKD